MRNFSKKLAFVLAAAMVFTAFAPAAKADAAEEMVMNRASQTLYVNEGVNDKGAETLTDGLYGNVQEYDFWVKNKPANYAKELKFAWESSDEKVATVDNKGLTKAVGVGTATITCTITDKATDDPVAEATAKVTVKANAAEVEITNADDYDMLPLPEDRVVDLNRAMYDEAGNKTSKRGTFVTDYTRWIAEFDGEATEFVTVDQATGTFTFAADAPAGDYTLYCETYQSEKYNQATASSDKVVVIVEDTVKEISIDQETPTKFVIDLGAKVDKVGAVEVIKLIQTSKDVYQVPVTLKSATHKDDKVTVELYSAVADKSNYLVKVEGYEDYTWTAYNGKPAEIILSGKENEESPFVTAGKEQPIYVTILDANGVNVTNDTYKSQIVYNVKEYSADGSYYVTETGMVYFLKEDLEAVVTAEYLSGEFDDNGNPVGNVPAEMLFYSVPVEPVKIETVTGTLYNTVKDKDTKGLTVPFGDSVRLDIKIKTSADKEAQAVVSGQEVNGGTISFETASPNVAAIDADRNLYLFKEGTATILVNWTVTDANGSKTEPIAAIPVTITEARKLTSLSLSSASVTVGTEAGFDSENLTIVAKDRYGDEVAVTKVEVTGVNALAKEVVAGVEENDTKDLVLNGATLKGALKNNTTAVQLTFTVKVNDAMTTNLTVLVKAKGAAGATQPGFAITDGKFENVERNVDSKDVKSVTITAFQMNNGIKVGYTDIAKAPAKAEDAVKDSYYVKIKKNNVDVTDNASITVTGSTITIDFTTTKTENTYNVVDYGLGAGTYVVELYKCTVQGGKQVLAKQNPTLTGTATKSGATYSAATRVAEVAELKGGEVTLDDALLKCFTIKDTKGADAAAPFYVDKLGNEEAGYVYVKSFTFYDDLGDGSYAAYNVPVNTSVKVAK